nr:alpha-tocopherol transfer protein-like [Onthophagus taurus]
MPANLPDVEEQFKRDPELKKDDLRILKEWLQKQAHLPKIHDLKLIIFLHCAYNNIEKAKVLIENFYTARTHAPELFLNRNLNDKALDKQADSLCMAILPTKTYGDTHLFFRFADPNADLFNYNIAIKGFDMAINLFQLQEGVVPNQVLILDSEGLNLSHVMKVSLTSTKKLAYYLQDCFPHRVKGIHIINVSAVTEKLFMFVKPFIKKEYVDLIHFHPKIETLYNHIDKDLMPSEYGGKNPSWKELQVTFKKRMFDCQEFFDQENTEFTDETKRVGKPKTMADIYGVEGTFKKLDID